MNIVHICLASSFTENMSYQDNLLSNQNALDGHNVTVISNTCKYVDGKASYAAPEDSFIDNGVRLIRLEYDMVLTSFISSKVRKVKALFTLLEELKPDIILFHGVSGWELLNVTKYKQKHPKMKLYADSHSDINNSATNFISYWFLYKVFYQIIFKKSLRYIDKVFYLSYECKDFLKTMYGVSENKMEFYPLGGIIFSDNERMEKRKRIRNELRLSDNDIMIVHSGKMDSLKRTVDILKAFSQVESDKMRLMLIGSMTDDVRLETEPLIEEDSRISFIGWKTADELMDYLCAADVYVQPGGQSATMQNAICCGCAMILYPHKSHEPYLQGNGYYVKTVEDMRKVFQEIADEPSVLKMMSEKSMKIARELLDYKKLAARLYK
jgi:glycosyltransferase involved in cell wall biosynthesis